MIQKTQKHWHGHYLNLGNNELYVSLHFADTLQLDGAVSFVTQVYNE